MEPTPDQLIDLVRQLADTEADEIDCDAVLDRVAAYLEHVRADEALPAELAAVGQHLKVCPSCFEEFEALVRAMSLD